MDTVEVVLAQKRKSLRRQTSADNRAGRFDSAGDAAKEVHEHLNAWTSGLSRYGQQAAFALIGANWAVNGTRSAILSNGYAKWSMAFAVGYLGLHLFLVGIFVAMVRQRHVYVDKDPSRWIREFRAAQAQSPWPYTACINRTGEFMWFLHMIGPVLSGVLLVTSFFSAAPVAIPKKDDPACAISAIGAVGPQHLAAITGFVTGSPSQTEEGPTATTAELQKAADLWTQNKKHGQQGLLLIVGATDRLALGKAEKGRFDANIGLAQARAEEVRRSLVGLISTKDVSVVPTQDQVMVLAAGPRNSPALDKCDACVGKRGFPEDRRVDIWAIWSAQPPKQECKQGK